MDLWSRIPVIALVLSPACKDKPDWPPVECGDVTCLPGEFCVVDANECSYVDDPCSSGETTGDGPRTCIQVEPGARHCEAVPSTCWKDLDGVGGCIQRFDFCPGYSPAAFFDDGFLRCGNGFYGECGIDGGGPSHDYCGACLRDEIDDFEE